MAPAGRHAPPAQRLAGLLAWPAHCPFPGLPHSLSAELEGPGLPHPRCPAPGQLLPSFPAFKFTPLSNHEARINLSSQPDWTVHFSPAITSQGRIPPEACTGPGPGLDPRPVFPSSLLTPAPRDKRSGWSMTGASFSGSVVKNPPAMQETRIQSLGQEDPLEKEMATHSSILAWEIPCTGESGGLQPKGPEEHAVCDRLTHRASRCRFST